MRPVWRGLAGVLGMITGCNIGVGQPDYGVPAPMYGVQDTGWRQYELTGSAVDAVTREAIPGIQVAFEGEADRTDHAGDWTIEADYPCDEPCILTADDVDGTANGTYAHLELEHPPEDINVLGILLEMEPTGDQ